MTLSPELVLIINTVLGILGLYLVSRAKTDEIKAAKSATTETTKGQIELVETNGKADAREHLAAVEKEFRLDLKEANREADAKFNDLSLRYDKLLEKDEAKTRKIHDLELSVTALQGELNTSKERIEGYTGVATARESIIDGLRDKVVSLEGVITRLEGVIKQMQERIDLLEAREKAAA